MPHDFKDYLPDLDDALKYADRGAADRKYQQALDEPTSPQRAPSPPAPRRADETAANGPDGSSTEKPRIVAEPPPATVSIPRPVRPGTMPRWKVAILAVTSVLLPAAIGILAVRHVRQETRPGSVPSPAAASTTVPAPVVATTHPMEAVTTAAPAPSSAPAAPSPLPSVLPSAPTPASARPPTKAPPTTTKPDPTSPQPREEIPSPSPAPAPSPPPAPTHPGSDIW